MHRIAAAEFYARTALFLFAVAALFCCRSSWAQTTVSIHDIMVTSGTYPLPNSPYLYSHYGQEVSVTGIVVGVMQNGDFAGTIYLSEPSGSWDNLVSSAEGLPVFGLSGLKASCAVVGASVTIVGKVIEANTLVSTDVTAANTPGTGIQPTSCTVNSTGNTMTQSISVSGVLSSFGDALKYTGMTTSATFYAVSPTAGSLTESAETETSTGQFWATLASNSATNNHLFRSAGIAGDEYVPSTAPSTVTKWGGNPQRVLIDTTTFGGAAVNITVGQNITCTTGSNITAGATKGIGLIDYTLGYARLLIFPTSICSVGGSIATSTSAAADATHFHVGTLDLYRFYSTTGATSGSVPVSATAYTRRLQKAALAIVDALGKPDIVSLQEVQDLPTLTDLANAVNTLGGTNYQPYLQQGNDPNSLNLGFLVNTSTVVVDSVNQVEASATYSASAGTTTLWERPPLVLQAEFVRTGKNYPVTVIDAHLTPRDNIGDSTLGADIRTHRAAQATDLSALVQSYQATGANVIVAGNLNSFEFSDGYVDVTGIVDGSPAAASAVTLYAPTSTTAALTDLVNQVSSTSRYNVIERGNAEVLEHILASATVTDASTASASLSSYTSAVTQPHFTADFAAVDENDATTPAGLTPHDGLVVAFLIPPVPTTASVSPTSLNFGTVDLGLSATEAVTVTNTTTFTSTINISKIAITGTNAADYSESSTCTSLTEGQTCTVSVTFTPTAVGTRTATLTISNDSTSDPALTVPLTGVGANTTATLTPSSATFPNTIVGAISAATTFTWTNTSDTPLTIGAVTITSGFTITSSTCSGSIAANASCLIYVTLTPTAIGSAGGTLTVTSNSSANGTLTSSLTGVGVGAISTSVSSLSFGNIDVGITSAAQTFALTNNTGSTVTLTSLTSSGDYSFSTTCGSALAAGTSCSFSVVFKPTTTGTRTGSIAIASSGGTVSVSLTGVGVDFSIAVAPTSGSIIAGFYETVNLTLTPLGGFNSAVTLSCSTNASGSTCTPAQSSLTPTTATTISTKISTTSNYTVIGYAGLGSRDGWLALASFGSLVLFLPRRRRVRGLALWIVFLAAASSTLAGCGNSPAANSNPTQAGTYTYTFSATDGSIVRTATYTLVVTSR